jgi:thiol-disulfide isomerase/thioredoxin
MRTSVATLVLALLAVLPTTLALAGCSAGPAASSGPGNGDTNYVGGTVGTTAYRPGERPQAPQVSGVTLTGQQLSLSSYRGKVVVLNFWASWCSPCRSEAPVLAQLSRTYQAKGVQFIGVNIKDPGQANGAAYERSFGIKYPSLYDPAGQVLLAFRDTVPPAAIPSTLVIDRTGHIAARVIGSVDYTNLKNEISGLAAAGTGGSSSTEGGG